MPRRSLRTHEAKGLYKDSIPWLDGLTRAWEQYLLYGGFPRSVSALLDGQPVPESFVDDLFDVVSADVFKNSQLPAVTEMALLERLWACPQRHDTRWLPKPKSQSKLYAIDPLVARLPHLRNSARPDLDPTVLTEMQIGMAVRRRVLVGKYTDRGSWRSEAATVNASEWDGILVTKNVLDIAHTDTAWAVPAGILAYFLDV